MPKHTFVVQIPNSDMYLTGYNVGNPSESTFGNLENAVEYETLDQAQTAAAAIGHGTVGTIKP